jgi:hypothetical protein
MYVQLNVMHNKTGCPISLQHSGVQMRSLKWTSVTKSELALMYRQLIREKKKTWKLCRMWKYVTLDNYAIQQIFFSECNDIHPAVPIIRLL